MKKILRLLLLLLIVVLAGCKPTINNITITIEGNDGTSITTVVIEEGKNVGEIADRNREGYDFDGWYLDSAFSTPFDPNLKIRPFMVNGLLMNIRYHLLVMEELQFPQ